MLPLRMRKLPGKLRAKRAAKLRKPGLPTKPTRRLPKKTLIEISGRTHPLSIFTFSIKTKGAASNRDSLF
jgi:hypothetical protein